MSNSQELPAGVPELSLEDVRGICGVARIYLLERRCYALGAQRAAEARPLGAAIAPEHDEAMRAMAEKALREFEALRADAERYRWLRQGDNDEEVLRFHEWAKEVCVDPPPMYLPRLERLDAKIDAAIAATKEQQ